MKKKFRKLVIYSGVLGILFMSAVQCFGKFPLVRVIYQFNDSLGKNIAGSGLGGRFVSTIFMWIMMIIPVYGVSFFLDLIIFNMIEFWTGSPLFMQGPIGTIKSVYHEGQEIRMSLVSEGIMKIEVVGAGVAPIFIMKDRPYEIFAEESGTYEPIRAQILESGGNPAYRLLAGSRIISEGILRHDQIETMKQKEMAAEWRIMNLQGRGVAAAAR